MISTVRRRIFTIALGATVLLGPASAGWAVAEMEPGVEEVEEAGAGAAPAPARSEAVPADETAAAGRVVRSGFTRAVVDREPTDTVVTLTTGADEVAYFTELRDLEGQRVVHRWSHGGEVVAEVGFDVGGPRWRVHSTKQLDPSRTGEWTVTVVDGAGRTLSEESFTYAEATEAPADADPAAAAAD